MSTPVQTSGAHHIRLTVTDPARSKQFYAGLLGFQELMPFPDGMLVGNGSLILGLRTAPEPDRAPAGDRLDPNRVGLDHLAISVASRADIEAVASACAERAVTCGEIVDLGADFKLYVMMIEDPDGIQLELTAPYS